jgi:hypothetical protein
MSPRGIQGQMRIVASVNTYATASAIQARTIARAITPVSPGSFLTMPPGHRSGTRNARNSTSPTTPAS